MNNINKAKVIAAGSSILIAISLTTSTVTYNYMNKKIETKESEVTELRDSFKNLKKEKVNLEKENKDFSSNNKNLDNKVKELKKSKEELDKKNAEVSEENKELKKFIEHVQKLPQWTEQDVTQTSNTSKVGLKIALKDTGLDGLEESFIEAENKYGINAIFLTSLVAQESGWGTSDRAKRDNNLSGYAVYSDSSKGKSFASKHDSIMSTAKLLKENYVKEGRKDIYSINDKYTPVNGHDWANNIIRIANKLVKKANVNQYIKGQKI